MSSQIVARAAKTAEPRDGRPAHPLRRAMDVLYRACAIIAGSALVLISLVVPWGVYTRYVLESAAPCRLPPPLRQKIAARFSTAVLAAAGMARRLVAFGTVILGLARQR